MNDSAHPACTSSACRTRAPALIVTAIGIGIVAGLMLESVLGLATPIALGVLLACACCARKRMAAGQALPIGRGVGIAAAALFAVGGFAFTVYVDIVDPAMAVESLVVGGLWICGGTASAALFLGICGARSLWRRWVSSPGPAHRRGGIGAPSPAGSPAGEGLNACPN